MQFSFSWMIVIQRTNKNSDVDGEVIMGLQFYINRVRKYRFQQSDINNQERQQKKGKKKITAWDEKKNVQWSFDIN